MTQHLGSEGFHCNRCDTTYPSPGDGFCRTCRGEALLDLSNPVEREMAAAAERQEEADRRARRDVVAVVVGLLVAGIPAVASVAIFFVTKHAAAAVAMLAFPLLAPIVFPYVRRRVRGDPRSPAHADDAPRVCVACGSGQIDRLDDREYRCLRCGYESAGAWLRRRRQAQREQLRHLTAPERRRSLRLVLQEALDALRSAQSILLGSPHDFTELARRDPSDGRSGKMIVRPHRVWGAIANELTRANEALGLVHDELGIEDSWPASMRRLEEVLQPLEPSVQRPLAEDVKVLRAAAQCLAEIAGAERARAAPLLDGEAAVASAHE